MDGLSRLSQIYEDRGLTSALYRGSTYTVDLPLRKIYSLIFQYSHGSGIDVMDQDWDNLIILDACRYDYFSKQIELEGELKPVISKGAHSSEFIQKNFLGKKMHDTIYVTANPYYNKLQKENFYSVDHLFDQWNERFETILPQDVVDRAINVHNLHPNKKIIVHFMQPHIPYLGSTAKKIRNRVDLTGYGYTTTQKEKDNRGITWWRALDKGKITEKEIKKAYGETLDIVLEHAEKLIESLDGKSVITADHGEMLGERGVIQKRYAHPHDIYTEQLRKVPWFVPPFDARRSVTAEQPLEFEKLDENTLDNRLRALGYK